MDVINMEVKIKQGNEMLDATIEMVDGVMVVSPKVVKFEPKDGDVFCVDSLHPCVGIVKEVYSYGKPDKDRLYFSVGYWKHSGNMQLETFCACNRNTEPNYRPATEEEKKLLFDKLDKEGYEWDTEKKELRKKRWKPSYSDIYNRPILDMGCFVSQTRRWIDNSTDEFYHKKGWVFQTQKECEDFCVKLNNAIKDIKP